MLAMDNFLPNMTLLKSPSNWFFVAFSVALLAIIAHILFKED